MMMKKLRMMRPTQRKTKADAEEGPEASELRRIGIQRLNNNFIDRLCRVSCSYSYKYQCVVHWYAHAQEKALLKIKFIVELCTWC